jgi:methionyl aminopeptidase
LKTALARNGVEKIWHPPQIRFGPNTVKPFGEKAELATLKENDLFFLDIGPVFHGHEGDVGRTYTVGTNPDFQRIAADSEIVFNLTQAKWAEERLSGQLLYDYAKRTAADRGWVLGFGGASGHRVSDFPHAVHYRGKLKTQAYKPSANRWILEIHLHDPEGRFGAFFEDLL